MHRPFSPAFIKINTLAMATIITMIERLKSKETSEVYDKMQHRLTLVLIGWRHWPLIRVRNLNTIKRQQNL